jgi:hypothetical protein
MQSGMTIQAAILLESTIRIAKGRRSKRHKEWDF